jgi:hypothetical protein
LHGEIFDFPSFLVMLTWLMFSVYHVGDGTHKHSLCSLWCQFAEVG